MNYKKKKRYKTLKKIYSPKLLKLDYKFPYYNKLGFNKYYNNVIKYKIKEDPFFHSINKKRARLLNKNILLWNKVYNLYRLKFNNFINIYLNINKKFKKILKNKKYPIFKKVIKKKFIKKNFSLKKKYLYINKIKIERVGPLTLGYDMRHIKKYLLGSLEKERLKRKKKIIINIKSTNNNTLIVASKKKHKRSLNLLNSLIEKYNLSFKKFKKLNKYKVYINNKYKKKIREILNQYVIIKSFTAGKAKFRKGHRGLPDAAETTGFFLGFILRKKFKDLNLVKININGKKRIYQSAFLGLERGLGKNIQIHSYNYINSIAHNGCKKKKRRRK